MQAATGWRVTEHLLEWQKDVLLAFSIHPSIVTVSHGFRYCEPAPMNTATVLYSSRPFPPDFPTDIGQVHVFEARVCCQHLSPSTFLSDALLLPPQTSWQQMGPLIALFPGHYYSEEQLILLSGLTKEEKKCIVDNAV